MSKLKPTDGREQWLVLTRWRDEESFQAWLNSDSFAHGHRSATERRGEGAPPPVATHSEVWSYVRAGGSNPVCPRPTRPLTTPWWNDPVKAEPGPSELLVIAAIKPWVCAACTAQFGRGNLLTMDDAGPLCLDCADLGHLEYLPRGDAALTRRAKRASRLSAVVVQWSRTRQRYERQGILAEVEAVDQAERECLADSEVRERRRERDARRRVAEDERFVAELADAIRSRFPGCSPGRAERIARHTGARSSGRIGRTSAGRLPTLEAVRLAVVASIRHEETAYEDLLMTGIPRMKARELVREDVDRVLRAWSNASAQP